MLVLVLVLVVTVAPGVSITEPALAAVERTLVVFSCVCIIVGALGVVGGIWLARDKRPAGVMGGIVIALLSLVPILFGAVNLAYIASTPAEPAGLPLGYPTRGGDL